MKVTTRMMRAIAWPLAALATASCGGGGASTEGANASLSAMAGVYEQMDYAGTIQATAIVDDQGVFMVSSLNMPAGFFEFVDLSGKAVPINGSGIDVNAVLYASVSHPPDPVSVSTTQTGAAVAASGTGISLTLDHPPPAYPSPLFLPRIPAQPGPYSVGALAGHYQEFFTITSPAFPYPPELVADFTLDAGGHIQGMFNRGCRFDGTLTVVSATLNVIRVTAGVSNCGALDGERTFLGAVRNTDPAHPSFSLWVPQADGQIGKYGGVRV